MLDSNSLMISTLFLFVPSDDDHNDDWGMRLKDTRDQGRILECCLHIFIPTPVQDIAKTPPPSSLNGMPYEVLELEMIEHPACPPGQLRSSYRPGTKLTCGGIAV